MIALQIVPTNTPEHFLDDQGRLVLDYCPEFKRSKKADQAELDRPSAEGVLGFFLVNTPKNEWALKNNFAYVQAWQDNIILPQTFLRVYNRTRRGMEVELVMDSSFWAIAIRKIKLCQLNLGTFLLTEANLRNNWANNARYNDGDSGLYFPLVHYGNWNGTSAIWDKDGDTDILISAGGANEADFRPWFHILYLLQQGFCSIGYRFRSPILETDWGRRLIEYVLVDLEGDNSLENFKVRVYQTETYKAWAVSTPESIPGNPAWLAPTEELQLLDNSIRGFDAGFYTANNFGELNADGSYNYYFFSGLSGEYEFEVVTNLDSSVSGDTLIFNLNLVVFDPTDPGSAFVGSLASPQHIIVGEGKEIRWKTPSLDLDPKYRYAFTITILSSTGFGEYSISGTSIQVLPKKVKFQPNMKLILKAWVNCEYKFDKMLSGIIHLIQGRLISDETTRTVWLLHSDKITLPTGEQPEPFFKGTNIEGEYDCTSHKETYRRIVENRYLNIGFKSPDDNWVTKQGYDGDNPIFAKKLDFGETYEEATSTNYNPFFEASDNFLAKDLQAIYVPNIECAVNIPALWDNEDYKLSNDITPRILYAFGLASQYRGKTGGGSDVIANWKFKGSNEYELPYAFQISNESIGLDENAKVPEQHVIYGERPNDLTSLYWKTFILELLANLEIDFQMIMTPLEFDLLNFRKWVNILIGNKHYVGRLTEITDYTGTKAEVTYRPIPDDTENCEIVYGCSNIPELEGILADSCLTINKLPGINSTINTDILSWRRVGDSWNVYSVPVCGCDVREFLDFTYLCSGADFTITDNSDCTSGVLGSVTLYDENNLAVDFWGLVSGSLVIPVSTLVSLGTSYIVATRSTPIGVLSKSIKIVAFGSTCSSILVFPDSDRTNQLIYYPIEIKREVSFTDGCPLVVKSKFV